ncbi:TlpA family protein disulfide reductase [Chitinophagaceae bacterium MMS25-I14]
MAYPKYELTAMTGEHAGTVSDSGKIVFLNFWFEACVPCRVEFDALNRLYDSIKADTNVRFMAVTFEDTVHLPRYIAYHHLKYPVASTTKEECERLNFYVGFPTSILLGKDGKIVIYETGGHLEKEKAEDFLLQKVLGKIRALER